MSSPHSPSPLRAIAANAGPGRQFLFSLLETLVADAQFGRALRDRSAALQPQLDCGPVEGFVVTFMFAGNVVFVVHGVVC